MAVGTSTLTTAVINTAQEQAKAKFPSEVADAVLEIVKTAVDQIYVELAALDGRITTLEGG